MARFIAAFSALSPPYMAAPLHTFLRCRTAFHFLPDGTHHRPHHRELDSKLVVHDYVVGKRIVVPATKAEGNAKVLDLLEAHEGLNAAKLSSGVLGVISKVYSSTS
ncbi:hypothetical protein L7F22_012219 [Adiantum nelumboides]|nr:hypothetical protein [Adiantum nelumboides]